MSIESEDVATDEILKPFLASIDEEESVHNILSFKPLRVSRCKLVFYYFSCLLTVGILPYALTYFPLIRNWLVTTKSKLEKCERLLIKSGYDKRKTVCKVKWIPKYKLRIFSYRYINHVIVPISEELEESGEIEKKRKKEKFGVRRIMFNVTEKPGRKELESYEKDREFRKILFGKNEMKFDLQTNIFRLFIAQLVHPFFLFQIFAVILWCIDQYFYAAVLIALVSSFSIILTVYSVRRNRMEMKRRFKAEKYKVSGYSSSSVFEKSGLSIEKSRVIISEDLVPGDIVEIGEDKEISLIPCDMIMLKSECYTNEAILTGENKPVLKSSLYKSVNKMNNIVYCGTVLVKKSPNEKVLGLVYKTGYHTKKGELIASILFSKPESTFEFYRDSVKFILIMVVVGTFSYIASLIKMIILGTPVSQMILRGLDIFTIIIPPSLPIAVQEGMTLSISQLKQQKISCLLPEKINIAGKVRTFCFDKTGTLTSDLLLLKETIPADEAKKENIIKCLGFCHSLTLTEDFITGEMIPEGDVLEVCLFKSTGYKLTDKLSEVVDADNNIVKLKHVFAFESKLQRMSVVTEENIVYTKGSPEKMRDLCVKETIPDDYDQIIDIYGKRGFRIIALAEKKLEDENMNDHNIPENSNDSEIDEENSDIEKEPEEHEEIEEGGENIEELKDEENIEIIEEFGNEELELDRTKFESNLNFLGFAILGNDLKSQTIKTIGILKDASVTSVMVTGDNPLTATYFAKKCGIVDNAKLGNSSFSKKEEFGRNMGRLIIIKQSPISDRELVWCDFDSGKRIEGAKIEIPEADENEADNLQDEEKTGNSKPSSSSSSSRNDTSSSRSGSVKEEYYETRKEEVAEDKEAGSSDDNSNISSNDEQIMEDTSESSGSQNHENKMSSDEEQLTEEDIQEIEGKKVKKLEEIDRILPPAEFNECDQYIITGPAFRILREDISGLYEKLLIDRRLPVFSRMSPLDKFNLICDYKTRRSKIGYVGMCGDGTNDMAAIKRSDCGVSVALNAEISLVSHFCISFEESEGIFGSIKRAICCIFCCICDFVDKREERKRKELEKTENGGEMEEIENNVGEIELEEKNENNESINKNEEEEEETKEIEAGKEKETVIDEYELGGIDCVPFILKTSKSSLQTSFAIFKFIISFSIVQTVSVIWVYYIGNNLGDIMFLYVDLLVIFPVCVLIGDTPPRNELIQAIPSSSLISYGVIGSVLFQAASFVLMTFACWLAMAFHSGHSWYTTTLFELDFVPCTETTVIFICSVFGYLNAGFSYSVNKPFKLSPFKENKKYVLYMAVMYGFSTYLIFANNAFSQWIMEYNLDTSLGLKILAIVYSHLLLVFLVELVYFSREQVDKTFEGKK